MFRFARALFWGAIATGALKGVQILAVLSAGLPFAEYAWATLFAGLTLLAFLRLKKPQPAQKELPRREGARLRPPIDRLPPPEPPRPTQPLRLYRADDDEGETAEAV